MSDAVVSNFHTKFRAVLEHQLQQRGSKLRSCVSSDTYTGENASAVDQIGAVNLVEITIRHGDTPYTPTPHTRRWVSPTPYAGSDLVDQPDKLRVLVDPTSAYSRNFAMAAGRVIDDTIIAAQFATAPVGKTITTATEAFSAAFEVPAGGVGLTIGKLRAGIALMKGANVDVDMEEIYCAVTANEWLDLLSETQVLSRDYNDGVAPIRTGKIPSLLNVTFVETNRLQASGGNQLIPLWCKSGMHLGIWNDIVTETDRLPTKNYSTQVYVRVDVGATRLEQGKVVRILCA